PYDANLEELVARFLSLLKPPTAAFTKQLPADVESNQLLIIFVIPDAIDVLLQEIHSNQSTTHPNLNATHPNQSTAHPSKSTTHPIQNATHPSQSTAHPSESTTHPSQNATHPSQNATHPSQSTTHPSQNATHSSQNATHPSQSATHPSQNTTHPSQNAKHPSQSTTLPSQSTTPTQFHHYIPRFILKTFAENFSLSNSEFTMGTSNPDHLWFKPGDPSKLRRKVRPRHDINVYRVEGHTTNLTNVSRAYGADDMYRDVTMVNCMKFEKLLAKHECTSATFIRKIWNEEEDLSLTRAQLADMKKFLVVMMYRSEHRRSQYFNHSFDFHSDISVRNHMEHNNISNAQTVWFKNLKWIIEASAEDIVMEYHKAAEARANPGIWFHNFFVVSPRFAIVLVNRLYLEERDKKEPRWTSMFSDQLHVFPETVYKKGRPSKDFNLATHATPDDVFKYKRIIVPKDEVYKVNSILLDDRRQFLTYRSNVSMYKTLRYYDKVKKTLFHDCHDYSILRRNLFSALNRTHPVDQ
ncbi:hypothetical protein BGZ95_004324, partial [Linnemannia exigua]